MSTTPHTSTPGSFRVGPYTVGGGAPLLVIAGPCVIESAEHTLRMAEALAGLARQHGWNLVFKASYDKANRSSLSSYRGPGLDAGLDILARVKAATGLPVLTDIHETHHAAPAAEVVDILQIPAFLCRQTDLLVAAALTGRVVNVKKGQFLSPHEVGNIVEKVRETAASSASGSPVSLTERGFSFGYNNLVVDMRGLPVMRRLCPVIFDATHSVQEPGGRGTTSGGKREFALPLAKAAAAVGIDGLFCEVHDNPAAALSDGPNQVPLSEFPAFLSQVLRFVAVERELSAGA